MAKAKTTEFVEYKEELLPKYYPGIVDSLWYPDEEPNPDENEDDNQEDDDNKDDVTE
jgi:hypothetical protein